MNLRMSLLSGAMVLALSVPAAAQYQTTPAQPATPGTAAALAPTFEEGLAQATSDLNLRAGPGMEHSPIGVIPAGATVEILDCLPDGVWCEVSYAGMTGYASERYLATAMDLDSDVGFAADPDLDPAGPEATESLGAQESPAVNGETPSQ